jgi:hypothetical protein
MPLRGFVRLRPPEHKHFADSLNHRRIRTVGEQVADGFASGPIVAKDLELDQFVSGQRAIDLTDNGIGDSGVADLHHGTEAVRTRFQGGAFPWCQ